MNQTAIINYCDFLERLQDLKKNPTLSCVFFMAHSDMGAPSTNLDPFSYVQWDKSSSIFSLMNMWECGRELLRGKLVYVRLPELVEHCKTVSMDIYLILNCYLFQPHSSLFSCIPAYLCKEASILRNPDKILSSISALIFRDDQKLLCKKNYSLY